MDVRSLAFRTDLALLQLGGSVVEDRHDHLVVRTPANPLFWWGNFLLLASVPIAAADADRWIARHAAQFGDARHVSLGFDVPSGTQHDLAAFAERGLTVEASTVMTSRRTHPPRTRNATATNRALTSDDDWERSVQLTMRCFPEPDSVGSEQFVRSRSAAHRLLADRGHGAWFGAFVDDRLVAQMGLFRAGDGLARFQQVETDPDFRRRGLAGTLLHRVSCHGFDELSARTLVMVADPEYVAVQLYRAVGFADTETQLQAARAPSG